MKKFLEEARKMIRIKSLSANGNEDLANYTLGLMQERGLRVSLQQVSHSLEEVSKRQFNVVGIMGDTLVDKKIRKGLLLTTHLDTVGPGLVESWTETGGDPFAATVNNGKIFGLGAVDAKLDFLCKLYAAGRFREKNLKMPIYLVGSCGEELGMFGSRYLIKSMALNPKFVVVGAPTSLKLVNVHKSMNIFRITVDFHQIERDARGFNRRIDLHAFGRSAHGSSPHAGLNAIESAFDFLGKAADSGFELRFAKFEGGDSVNQVPDRAMAQFYLTSHQFEDFKRFFREVVSVDGMERAFRVDLGGVGDTGVRFLPEPIFSCMLAVSDFFKEIASDFEKVRDDGFDPLHSTASFGLLRQRQDRIDLYFDLRLLPGLIVEKIERHVQDGIQKIANGYPKLNLTVTKERANPSLNVSSDSDLVKTCREAMLLAGVEAELAKGSLSTEAAQFQQAGYDAVVFGPGEVGDNSHGPNENINVDQLEKAVAFYEKLIEKTCV